MLRVVAKILLWKKSYTACMCQNKGNDVTKYSGHI